MEEDLHAVREIFKHVKEQKEAKQTTAEKLSNDWRAADTDEKRQSVINLAHKLAGVSVELDEVGNTFFSFRDRSMLLFHKEHSFGGTETFLSELAPARRLIDCSLDDPLCFFLREPCDKGLTKCEQVQGVSSGEISKKPTNELTLEIPYVLFRKIAGDSFSTFCLEELLKALFVECGGKRKADNTSLNASNDDLRCLGRFEGIRILVY